MQVFAWIIGYFRRDRSRRWAASEWDRLSSTVITLFRSPACFSPVPLLIESAWICLMLYCRVSLLPPLYVDRPHILDQSSYPPRTHLSGAAPGWWGRDCWWGRSDGPVLSCLRLLWVWQFRSDAADIGRLPSPDSRSSEARRVFDVSTCFRCLAAGAPGTCSSRSSSQSSLPNRDCGPVWTAGQSLPSPWFSRCPHVCWVSSLHASTARWELIVVTLI